MRLIVDAAPERPRLSGLEHADRVARQRGRAARVRPLRLGAVALLGLLGGPHGAVGGGGKRLDGRSQSHPIACCRLARRRCRERSHGFPAAGRWPALSLARPAVAEDRRAPRAQARCGARVRARQFDRPYRGPQRCGDDRHRHRRQGAPRLHGGVASARDPARRTGGCRRTSLQAGADVPGRAHAHGRVRARAERGARDRGEGRHRRNPAARPVLQRCRSAPRSLASEISTARRWCRRSASCARRA